VKKLSIGANRGPLFGRCQIRVLACKNGGRRRGERGLQKKNQHVFCCRYMHDSPLYSAFIVGGQSVDANFDALIQLGSLSGRLLSDTRWRFFSVHKTVCTWGSSSFRDG